MTESGMVVTPPPQTTPPPPTTPPDLEIPATGADIIRGLGFASLAVIAGAFLVVIARRRRNTVG